MFVLALVRVFSTVLVRKWFAFISFGLDAFSFTFGSVGNGIKEHTQHFSAVV